MHPSQRRPRLLPGLRATLPPTSLPMSSYVKPMMFLRKCLGKWAAPYADMSCIYEPDPDPNTCWCMPLTLIYLSWFICPAGPVSLLN
ncbi:hypothetical protein BJY01DRAFT_135866 [Aspergillus pseudoustus]|uniref:Uncharacterized protein n=1 Tax=Aspergillus pseudoustus TaxID=1810923 RepID=A0ABR4KG01_9EURO